MRNIKAIIPWLIAAYVLLFAIAWVDWGFIRSEVTAYPLQCSHEVDLSGMCNSVDYSLRATTYKIDSSDQQVVYWVEGFDVGKLTECAVRDRKNWTCKYSDSNTEIGFNDGNYFEIVDQNSLTAVLSAKTLYVSRHQWLLQSCQDSWIPFPLCFPFIQWINNTFE